MLGILAGDLSDFEKSRISDLGLNPNSADDLASLRTRLTGIRSGLVNALYIDYTVENMQNDPVASAFYSQTSVAGKAAIQKEYNKTLFGDPSVGDKPDIAFVYQQNTDGVARTYIVSRNFFGGRGQKGRANTLIHEASHLTANTVDKSNRGGIGFDNAYKLSNWITMRPEPTR